MKNKNNFILILIFILALFLRLLNINWDSGQHLHPDERFLTMYSSDSVLPDSLGQYLSLSSPLNPYNFSQYKFFVYGTFPILLSKLIAQLFSLDSYQYIHLVGRGLSALFDSFNIFLLFYLFKLISKKPKKSLIPALIYATAVLPIQLSHFFAVDTFLNLFLFASFVFLIYWLDRYKNLYLFLSSICFSAAVSSKISALLFSPIIFIIFLIHFYKSKKFKTTFILAILYLIIFILSLRLLSPYYFSGLSPNPDFLISLKTLKNLNSQFFPPAIQWFSKTKFIFPFKNLFLWGLGLPFSLGLFLALSKKSSKPSLPIFVSFLWLLILFIFQSAQFSYALRYFLLIIPHLVVIFSFNLLKIKKNTIIFFLCFHFLFCISFLNIYLLPNSRLQASNWIYQNIARGSTISCDHWDDCLPLPTQQKNSSLFTTETLHLFDQDNTDKWINISDQIKNIDYIIMSSNRLWASIPAVPDFYPQSTLFYQQLFSGQKILDTNTSFSKIAQFNNYPGFYMPFLNSCLYIGKSNYPGVKNKFIQIDHTCFYPGIYFRDDTADESFTVYDHPQVLIFKKN